MFNRHLSKHAPNWAPDSLCPPPACSPLVSPTELSNSSQNPHSFPPPYNQAITKSCYFCQPLVKPIPQLNRDCKKGKRVHRRNGTQLTSMTPPSLPTSKRDSNLALSATTSSLQFSLHPIVSYCLTSKFSWLFIGLRRNRTLFCGHEGPTYYRTQLPPWPYPMPLCSLLPAMQQHRPPLRPSTCPAFSSLRTIINATPSRPLLPSDTFSITSLGEPSWTTPAQSPTFYCLVPLSSFRVLNPISIPKESPMRAENFCSPLHT